MNLPAGSSMTCFGPLQEEGQGHPMCEAERIPHLIPILESLPGQEATEAPENRTVMATVHRLREACGADHVQVQTIRWRGETEESIREQLQPMLIHYRAHILFVNERTQRRFLETEEQSERVPLVTELYRTTPIQWRLQSYVTKSESRGPCETESMLGTSVSTTLTAVEERREKQLRASFERFAKILDGRSRDSCTHPLEQGEMHRVTAQTAMGINNRLPLPPLAKSSWGRVEEEPNE